MQLERRYEDAKLEISSFVHGSAAQSPHTPATSPPAETAEAAAANQPPPIVAVTRETLNERKQNSKPKRFKALKQCFRSDRGGDSDIATAPLSAGSAVASDYLMFGAQSFPLRRLHTGPPQRVRGQIARTLPPNAATEIKNAHALINKVR